MELLNSKNIKWDDSVLMFIIVNIINYIYYKFWCVCKIKNKNL